MPVVAILLLILAGLLSVVLTEVVAVTIMTSLPASVDTVGNYFLYNLLPATLIVGGIVGLVFGRVMRRESFKVGLVYVVVYVAGQFAMLSELRNSLDDRLSYLMIALPIALLVLVWRRLGGARVNSGAGKPIRNRKRAGQ